MGFKKHNRKDPSGKTFIDNVSPIDSSIIKAIKKRKEEKRLLKEISDKENQHLYYDICVNKK